MELQPETAADDIRLGTDVRFGNQLRAGWQGEAVEVPLEPGPFGD